MKDFLSAQEVISLKAAHRSEKDRKSADRIKTIPALNEGLTYRQVTRLLLLDATTIRRYAQEYRQTGVDGLLEYRYRGSTGFLTEVQKRNLEIHLRANTYRSVKAICHYARAAFGATYSIEGMTRLVHSMGFVYKKTKVVPGKFDPRKQAFFRKFYAALKECKGPDDRIYFLDATHPQHNTKAAYGWMYKGRPRPSKVIPADSGCFAPCRRVP